jgi:hypothetical protein
MAVYLVISTIVLLVVDYIILTAIEDLMKGILELGRKLDELKN